MAKKKSAVGKDDPYRPAKPNKLYFKQLDSAARDEYTHYWELRSSSDIIAESFGYHTTKLGAIQNAIAIFSKEIWAGYHIVADPSDKELVIQEGLRIEGKLART